MEWGGKDGGIQRMSDQEMENAWDHCGRRQQKIEDYEWGLNLHQ
jgi:hypothetical protein